MKSFKNLTKPENLQELIDTTFDINFPISGEWGYSEETATIIHKIPNNMPILQLQHTITSIRAHLEMNITQEKDNRCGGINANEKSRELITKKNALFNKVTYEITAMKEELYNAFIKEYKEGYETKEFDLSEHFNRRKEATLIRHVIHYFEVTAI